MLSCSHLTKSYHGQKIIEDISVSLDSGAITCLIGPSGSGKTTLLKCLSLIEEPDSGQITLDDHSYSFPLAEDQTLHPLPWPKLTVVFQSLFLWPHLTLRENILLPARNVNPQAEKDIEGLIKIFEMQDFIDRYPNQSSGGQRQRVALARALILNPRYVLLDEITSALDVEQTARILTKLSHLKDRNIGVLLITHHLNFARKIADQILFLDQGHVIESGGRDILAKPQTERFQSFLAETDIIS
jgi:ABC-type polar amino acid transport system ATPase subunit